jgi:heptaprenyl diphosphate synthase
MNQCHFLLWVGTGKSSDIKTSSGSAIRTPVMSVSPGVALQGDLPPERDIGPSPVRCADHRIPATVDVMQTVTAQRFSDVRAIVEAHDASLAAQLDEVERRLRATLANPRDAFISKAATHLIDAGGKRFRPLMVLLGASFGSLNDRVLDAAVVTELVHVGTLYHDDVMDEARIRHGVASANVRWNNTVAVLLGDYLLAKAAEISSRLGEEVMQLQVRTLNRLVTGQIAETVGPREGVDRIGHCLRVMADKSASLISMAAKLGAMMAGADPRVAETLEQFGELLGIAFQISDDVLDIAADATNLGKAPGTDLREGIVTLPVLHAMADNPRLAEIVHAGPVTDDNERAEALELLRTSPGLDRARQDAVRYAERAKSLLHDLPALPARAALAALCDFVTGRPS